MMKGRIRRAAAFALSLMLCMAALLCLPTEAGAYEQLDLDAPCSLELSYHPSHGEMNGIGFSLYRVADIGTDASLTFTKDWKDVPVSMADLDADGWAKLASTLDGYIAGDKTFKADYYEKTDVRGDLKFSDVKSGVYVLVGDSHEVRETERDGSVTVYRYEPRPEMVILPYLEQENGWIRDRVIEGVKFEVTDTTETPAIDRRVIKVWDDSGHTDARPRSIEVALLKNDTVHEVVTLDASNAWRHDWTGLDANASWRVVELTRPLSYQVTSYRQGSTFVLTNTYVADDPQQPWTPPERPSTPPDVPEPSTRPSTPIITVNTPDVTVNIPDPGTPLYPWSGPSNPTTPTPTTDIPDTGVPLETLGDPDVPLEDLPQTGQLWWPVPILAGIAVACFGMGVALLRKKD